MKKNQERPNIKESCKSMKKNQERERNKTKHQKIMQIYEEKPRKREK